RGGERLVVLERRGAGEAAVGVEAAVHARQEEAEIGLAIALDPLVLVVAAQRHDFGRGPALELLNAGDYAPRIGSAIDVVAKKHQGVAGSQAGQSGQQAIQRGEVAVDVADGKGPRGHAGASCKGRARDSLQTLRAVATQTRSGVLASRVASPDLSVDRI